MKTNTIMILSEIMLVLTFVVTVSFAQNSTDKPIYGEVSALRGMTKVYVEGATSDERKLILDQFKRDKTFSVVGDPSDAEFFISFGELTRMAVAAGIRPSTQYQERDEAEAYYVKDGKKVIVWQDTETLDVSNGFSFSFPNSVNLTRNFIKAYKKALKEKKN